jgi:hypothetical protein
MKFTSIIFALVAILFLVESTLAMPGLVRECTLGKYRCEKKKMDRAVNKLVREDNERQRNRRNR